MDARSRDTPPGQSAAAALLIGTAALCALVLGFGIWATQAQLAGAIVAQGRLAPQTQVHPVQHAHGGIVAAVHVADGAVVAAGAPLLRLDGTALRAELAILEAQQLEVTARTARLVASRDGLATPRPPPAMAPMSDALARLLDGQSAQLAAERAARAQEDAQIAQRQALIDTQITGLVAQRRALETQSNLIALELAAQQDLMNQGLARAPRLLALRRERAAMAGQIGALVASEAEARERQAALDLQRLRRDAEARASAIAELRDLRVTAARLGPQIDALRAKLDSMEIRAPIAGTVHRLAVVGPGAVLRPAEPILQIVPGTGPPTVALRLPPHQIDAVRPGQAARIEVSARDGRFAPAFSAVVTRISADAITDPASGAAYFEVALALEPQPLGRAPPRPLLPGMPVEVYLRTRERAPLAYLLDPLAEYFRRALREG